MHHYLDQIHSFPHLDANQERELAVRAKDDPAARKEFIEANLRLVVWAAKKYARNGNLDDLISEGNIGLIKAVEGYDPSRGFRFSTYALWNIKHSIIQYKKGLDRLPEELQKLEKKMDQAIQTYIALHGREPDEDYLSQASTEYWGKTLSPSRIRELKRIFYEVKDQELNETENYVSPIEAAGTNPEGEILDNIEHSSLTEIVKAHIERLPEKEVLKKKILEGQDYPAIAQFLGITREQARAKCEKLTAMLRSSLRQDPYFQG